MIKHYSFLILLLVMSAALPVMSAEIQVPGNYETIQEAIEHASGGDTISVAAGRYQGPLSITNRMSSSRSTTAPSTVASVQVGMTPIQVSISPGTIRIQ